MGQIKEEPNDGEREGPNGQTVGYEDQPCPHGSLTNVTKYLKIVRKVSGQVPAEAIHACASWDCWDPCRYQSGGTCRQLRL